MKVYISGPITGCYDYMERFREAERCLRQQGDIPYNPAAINSMMPMESEYEDYMAIALSVLGLCDAVYLLNGWEDSRGANREYGFATARGMIIMRQQEDGRKDTEAAGGGQNGTGYTEISGGVNGVWYLTCCR